MAFLLCMGLCIGAVSALDTWYFQQKQSVLSSYKTPLVKPVPGPGGAIPAMKPVFIGTLPRIIREGDLMTLNVIGDLKKGQKIGFAITNGQFMVPGDSFVFNITGMPLPAAVKDMSIAVTAQPVSLLQVRRVKNTTTDTLESSSPDPYGKITIQASGIDGGAQAGDSLSVTGTPTANWIGMTMNIEAVLTEDLQNPTFLFRLAESERGSFTLVVSVNGSERSRQTVFVF
jgi:hypothetical protein